MEVWGVAFEEDLRFLMGFVKLSLRYLLSEPPLSPDERGQTN